MNGFFERYADLTALLLTVLAPIAIAIFAKRKSKKKVRALPAYFLLFGPLGIVVFMFFHLAENTYRALTEAVAGTFVYDFRFYSLIMLGIVLGGAGTALLNACVQKCFDKNTANSAVLKRMLLVAVISIPLIPIIVLGYLPLILSAISLLAMPFVNRKTNTVHVLSEEEDSRRVVAFHS